MRLKLMAIFTALLLTNSIKAYAISSGAISNENPSADYLGNLLSITGSKIDPTAVYTNPAAIGDQGKFNSSIGMAYYNFSAERTGSNGTSDKMETGKIVVPNFAVTNSIGKFGWGLAVLSPYGLETEWSETSNVRYVATKSTLKMFDITPAVSYRPSEKLAFGLGLDYFSTFDADLQKKVAVDVVNFLLTVPTAGSPDANSKLSGDGDQWGYHGGLLYNPSEKHTFGMTYHSEVKTKIEGELEITGLSGVSATSFGFGGTNFKTDARIDLFYPQNVQFGYKYSHAQKWEAGFNLAWYDWSSNKQFEIVLPNANATQRAIAANPIPLNWRDVWSATIGGTYHFSENWRLNAGAYYLPAVYPESTFTPAVPDLDKIGISVGPCYRKGNWAIDTVYNPLFYKTTTINNTLGQTSSGLASADISGEYKAMIHIFGLNVRYHY